MHEYNIVLVVAFLVPYLLSFGAEACDFEIEAENATEIAHNQTMIEQMRSEFKQLVDQCNKLNGGMWKAALNERVALMTSEQKKRLNGLLPINSNGTAQPMKCNHSARRAQQSKSSRRRKRATCTTTTSFDARTQWSNCSTIIGAVSNQANCGDCWAVATATSYSARYCIQRLKQGTNTDAASASSYFSALDILECSPNQYGCNGGSPYYAWNWIKSSGLVTGTNYSTASGCKPYPFNPNSNSDETAPSCTSTCSNSAWTVSYSSDKQYANATGYLIGNKTTVTQIENEIKANGPIAASMDVYSDFYTYKSGVYTQTSTTYEGSHAVTIIGWGTQTCSGTSQDYWLAVNSWGTDWGLSGLFMIAKGVDEVGIESGGLFWGTPKV